MTPTAEPNHPHTHPGTPPPHPAGRLPELLAPAGNWECARAAVANGADAIYFGLNRFNARLRAGNFSDADLPELMRWLHARGVKGYVTFNTLVFTRELPEATDYLRSIITAGVDAVIVQDVGICRVIRRLSPDFPIHGSTQMTVTSAAGVAFARRLGCQVVVLARENSLAEIERIQTELPRDPAPPNLEIFVHGALCVAYSGQCLTSEALGGRSANRGECAQACRMPYELVADGRRIDLGDRRYLLSPQDLAGLEALPDIVRTGVSCLKIEGRLKSPEYVASITRLYRAALDRLAWDADAPAPPPSPPTPDPAARYEMEMAFSRGLFPGWLKGIDNQRLVHGRFGKKRGVFLGEITRVGRDRVWLRPVAPLTAGDGVVFDAGRPDLDEQGGRIFAVHPQGAESAITFMPGAVDFRALQPGHRIWKTSDPRLEKRLRQSFENESSGHPRPITIEIRGRAGEPIEAIARDQDGHEVSATSAMPLETARQQPLDRDRLLHHFGRLGGTPFLLGHLESRLEGNVLLPVSELNRLRRDLVARLDQQRQQPRTWTLSPLPTPALLALNETEANPSTQPTASTPADRFELTLLVRSLPQLDAALDQQPAAVYCEFEDPKRYRDAVRIVRARTSQAPPVFVAPPRIFKPGEDWILAQVRSAEADGILVRNVHHIDAFQGARLLGDFSLNVANPLTAEYFIREARLERVTASYDLNADQLEDLLRGAPPHWFEITLHQHMPMFHMEHCVFCAFLSKGRDYRDCGRPCDRHSVRLRDRVGAEHPLKADAGCRNTVFNARAQTGAEHAARLLAAGARRFRLEFLDESPDDVRRLTTQYRRLLLGETDAESLWRQFKLLNQLGVTRGQLGRASGADLGVDRWTDSRAYAASW